MDLYQGWKTSGSCLRDQKNVLWQNKPQNYRKNSFEIVANLEGILHYAIVDKKWILEDDIRELINGGNRGILIENTKADSSTELGRISKSDQKIEWKRVWSFQEKAFFWLLYRLRWVLERYKTKL